MTPKLSMSVLLSLNLAFSAAAQQSPTSTGPQMKVVSINKLGMGVDPVPVTTSALIQKPAVQKALGLTESQRKKVESLEKKRAEAWKRQAGEARVRLRELGSDPDGESRKAVAQAVAQALNEAGRRGQDETDAAVLRALDPKMRTRLREIQYQVEGPLAFERPELLEKLFLDEVQLDLVKQAVGEGLRQIVSDAMVTIRDTDAKGQARAPSEKEIKTAITKNTEAATRSRSATTKAILKILTKAQRARYEKLLGEPFDLAKLRVDESAPSADSKESLRAN
jgi:Spy/CpxP family protein refolding chaperone